MDELTRLRILLESQTRELERRYVQDKDLRDLRMLIYRLMARVSEIEVALRMEKTQQLPKLPTDRLGKGG